MIPPQTRIRRASAKPKTQDAAALTRVQFSARPTKRAKEAAAAADRLDPDVFDSGEDEEDLVKHYNSAKVQPLSRRDIAGSKRRAKARKHSTTVLITPSKALALRKAQASEAKTNGTGAKRVRPTRARRGESEGPTRVPATLAQRVQPGVSLGPPRRYIGTRFITPEVNISEAKFRRQQVGIGKCTGGNLTDVRRAYAFAYVMLDSAKEEVRAIKRNPTDARVLWHASMESEEASLSYWFGQNYTQQVTMTMLHKLDEILTEWSMAFCGGFRDILPVFIRCKSKNGVGGGPARHIAKNTIELFPRYFDMPRARQSITMLHEMGHRCKSLLKPRDERHDLCSGGWNGKENMCYRDTLDVGDYDDIFRGGNPRILAAAATAGNGSAKKTLLNNIDNYVCYMWNRYADHGEQTMYLLSEGGKQAKPTSSGKGKPIG